MDSAVSKRVKVIKIIQSIIFFLILIPVLLPANEPELHLSVGEKLTYKVTWGVFKLGTLKFSVLDTLRTKDQLIYQVQMNIDSNPWLFFVNMHSTFISKMTENNTLIMAKYRETIDDEVYNSIYEFDYDKKKVYVHYEGVENQRQPLDKEIPIINNNLHDGISMVYYACRNCEEVKKEHIPVFDKAKESYLDINFTGKQDSIDIDYFPDKVAAYYINGNAKFKSTAGFSGDFEGWFSPDKQHVPLKAKMNVFIGSVQLELQKCETGKN